MKNALTEAVELLNTQGLRREAILLVERSLQREASRDSVLLLTLLLLQTGARTDAQLARSYLRKLQLDAYHDAAPTETLVQTTRIGRAGARYGISS